MQLLFPVGREAGVESLESGARENEENPVIKPQEEKKVRRRILEKL